MNNLDRLKMKADLTESSYFQWAMIRAMAFGERDWIVLCSIMFLLSDTRDFLTVAGVTALFLGIVFLGPIFGILIYYMNKLIYFRRKKKKTLPSTARGLKLITWVANGYCFPLILLTSWLSFGLFYEGYDIIIKSFTDVIHF